MKLHQIYGLALASAFPFAHRLAPGLGVPDLTFSCTSSQSTPGRAGHRLYSSPWRDEDGESIAHFDRFPGADVLRFPGIADFYLTPGRIDAHPLDPAHRDLLELRLLGPVLSFWLERMGIPVLHASAVHLEGQGAIGFVAHSGGGKSSLAASSIKAGSPLLTDDILPLEEAGESFRARPGFPQMRMIPEGARRFLGSTEGLALVCPGEPKLHVPVGPDGLQGFGTFRETPSPLSRLYVLDRQDDADSEIQIQPLTRREAVIELVRHSFSPYLVEAVGLQPRRLDLFSRLVRQVPVRRLVYPSGFAALPRVIEAVMADHPGSLC